MRDIEFRVWVDEHGVFADECCVYNDGSASYEINHYDIFGVLIKAIGSGVGEDDSLEQYIGIKDKNGTKIFEGDAIDDDGETYIVIYDSSNAMFIIESPSTGDRHFINDKNIEVFKLEITGNIHQNPELKGG